jgi:glycosyltransferase involved in cell wall biosynthesis
LKLTIAMPSKNQGAFISAALDNLVAQHQGRNLEVIVRDCMSTDCTEAALAKYDRLPFVHVRRELDHGQSDAIATAFQNSSGDILGWLNSDDVLYPRTVDRVLEFFSSNPDIDILYGDAVFIDAAGRTVGRFPTATPTLQSLTHRCVISQPSVFFRREAYLSVGGLNRDRRYCMDYELWLRFARQGLAFGRIKHVCSATRLHDSTKTFTGGLDFIDEICHMQEELLGYVSPVWSVYKRARSGSLAGIPSKTIRFCIATLKEVRSNPLAAFAIGGAFMERTARQCVGNLRWRFST